jgi:uncharacterized protein YaiL (DUF2058 family)
MAKLSLQEQMLKAGLVNEKKLKKAKKSSKKSRDLAKEVKASVQVSQQEKVQRAKELNQEQKQAQHEKEILAQVKQLVNMNKLDLKKGDIKYNFTDGSVIKYLHVTTEVRDQLLNGILAIARDNDTYSVIPNAVAKKILERNQDTIVEQKSAQDSQSEELSDEDDPYADYVVPDDLMW